MIETEPMTHEPIGPDLLAKMEDRFHLVQDVIDRVPLHGSRADDLKQMTQDKLIAHKHDIDEHGKDMPEILDWQWGA